MKKWNRALAILLAAGLTAGLCGCESGADNPSSLLPAPNSQAVENVPTPTPTPTPEPTPEPTPTPEPEPHGLILAELDYSGGGHYTVQCIDPKSGNTEVIRHFTNYQNSSGVWNLGGNTSRPNRIFFSEDFSKIMCTVPFPDDIRHIGWVDTEGNFFDVSAALGLKGSGDFDNMKISYGPIGFRDGLFGFVKYESDRYNTIKNTDYYYVPLDNIVPSAVQEGDIRILGCPHDEDGHLGAYFENSKLPKWYDPSSVTDWIDDTRCIVDNGDTSAMLDLGAGTGTNYIPGGASRKNWSGVVSPDKTWIAFLSMDENLSVSIDTWKTDTYIVSINGGDPVKMANAPYPLEISGNIALIDWL